MHRLRRTLLLAVVAAVALVLAAPAAVTPPARAVGEPGGTITVGIKPLDPFVQKQGDHYTGFSIELWDEIARRNSWKTEYSWHDQLSPLLDDVQTSQVDAAIAGISITRDREQVLDFSYPMFNAGLQVMAGRASGANWTDELRGFVVAGVGRYLLALIVVLLLAGNVVWLASRRREPPRGYLAGVGLGMYKAAGVGLAGDFGVGEPERPLARFAAVVWAIVGVCFVSLFTAAVTTQLTVQSIQSGITGVQDLSGRYVVTVQGTSATRYLAEHAIAYRTVNTIEEAYPLLDNGTADAIVFDAPVLQHRVTLTGGRAELLAGGIFAHEDYGIAFPTGSVLRKKVNTTLLDMRADGSYDRIYEHYFGAASGS